MGHRCSQREGGDEDEQGGDEDGFTQMEEDRDDARMSWEMGWASTCSGAPFALQVSIAVWSEAAGIWGRKEKRVV